MANGRVIALRGVRVHNLKSIDLDIPRGKLVVICGVSGSGKSSVALDTLYAEGQRRYLESFPAYSRQFLQRLEKPAADAIEGVPPALAVTGRQTSRSNRSTVATTTEIADYLRLLLAKIGKIVCPDCKRPVERFQPQTVAERLQELGEGTRFLITFPVSIPRSECLAELLGRLRESGFLRIIAGTALIDLSEGSLDDLARRVKKGMSGPPGHISSSIAAGKNRESFSIEDERRFGTDPSPSYEPLKLRTAGEQGEFLLVVVDRLVAGTVPLKRLRDSLETAFEKGKDTCVVLIEQRSDHSQSGAGPIDRANMDPMTNGNRCFPQRLENGYAPHQTSWKHWLFTRRFQCRECGREFIEPQPRLFSFNHPLGACRECEGFGDVIDIDLDLVVPDKQKSIRQGAIAPWNYPAFAHELEELLALAEDYDLPVDIPFAQLEPWHLSLIMEGVPERDFGGLRGFFAWLERRKYKMHYRVFLSRWRSYRPCPSCGGKRFRPEVLAIHVGGRNIAELFAMTVTEALKFFSNLELSPWEKKVGKAMLEQIIARLTYLENVGLGYLTLDRPLRTLSGGELRRVALTAALGSSLVNMLYVLDEPSVGLHPRDIDRLIAALNHLRNRGNTVVVVEHDQAIIRSADHVIEIGPAAGEEGGRVVFQGTVEELLACKESLTGDWLAGRRRPIARSSRRSPQHGWIRLIGARGHNLKNITVAFPLRVLCLVTGVSGSGKSTLVQDTLYPALCRRLRIPGPKAQPYDELFGDGQIGDVVLVDQTPIGRSSRSNPVTYAKAFDEIRLLFAETPEARRRGYTPSHFSFNVDGGRCPTCAGEGQLQIEMQFLADVYVTCPDCQGKRFRKELLEVAYRGYNIAQVLEMTVRDAFTFFRGQPKIQQRLKQLIDVGLDYLRLGQSAQTLSGGEAQRLKLASYLSSKKGAHTLFILDEPTTGLHDADVLRLCDCFDALLNLGHSFIVVEHNLHLMAVADYIIDLGPGAADEGGQVVVHGPPEVVAACPQSITGKFLGPLLRKLRRKG